MTDFLIYDLKVAVLIIVFYMFYRLMLARETYHRVNRIVLLATAVLSFVLPLCVITMHETVTMQTVPTVEVGDMQMQVVADEEVPLWQSILPVLYIIGVAAVVMHTVWSILKVVSLIKHCEQHPLDDGITLCVTGNAEVAPFSWMRYIVMNRSDYEAQNDAILAHERGHIRLRHSYDVLLVDLLTALQWFNPAMWMLRQDLRAIHEYEADGAVLSQGINARQYQYLLISKAASIGGYSIANGISHSTLKNRIHMMTNKKTRSSHLLKLLALVPIIGTALALNARTVTDYVYDGPQKKQIIKKGKANAKINAGTVNEIVVVEQAPAVQQTKPVEMPNPAAVDTTSRAFDVVEQMPQFPGGLAELMQFLGQNVRYPEEAHKNNIQGRVIVTFVVEKDGSISEAHVAKSVDPLLDAEALRVVNSMPNWLPGRQNGEPVRVKYTVPITFKLQGDAKTAKENAIILGKEHNGKGFTLVIDGKAYDLSELNSINPADIDSVRVEKAKDGRSNDRVIIKMKKKN